MAAVADTLVVVPEWQECLRRHGLVTVAALWQHPGGTVLKQARSTEVRRLDLADGDQSRVVFVKKYWVTKTAQLWSGALRGTWLGRSKVRREFVSLQWLRAHGFDAPAPIAWGEERRHGWLRRSCLLSAGLADPVPLDQLIHDRLPVLPPDPRRRRRRELVDALAAYVRRLHAARFGHGDLYWRNIILRGDTLDQFALLDAHQGRCWRFGNGQTARVQDLATLDAPAPAWFRRSERLRFFLRYRGHTRLEAADRVLLRRVLRAAAPLRARQLARVQAARR